jgi:iron complex transport system substrate-binding protein
MRRLVLLLMVAWMGAGCGGVDRPVAATGAVADGRSSTCNGPRTAVDPSELEPISDPSTPVLPVTVTDRSGVSVTVTDTSRILALDRSGTLGATVYALGQGDRLVGRDISTGIPALVNLPVVTSSGHDLNAEAILSLRPTVVLTDYTIGPLEVQLQLRDAGIPVVILDEQRNRSTIEPQIRAVAEALGVPTDGERLARAVHEEIESAEAEIARDGGHPHRMVFLYLRGSAGIYYWFGRGSGADDLIDALGGVDVGTESGLEGYRPVNAEAIVAAAPEVVMVMTEGLESVGGVDGLLDIPGLAETPAGKRRCVIDMRDDQILGFGPQFPGTLRALHRALSAAEEIR